MVYQLLDQSKNSSNCQVDLPANEKASSALPYSCQPMRNIPRSRIGAGHGIAGAVSIISNHRLTQEQGNLIRGVITWSQPPPTWLNRNHGIMPTWPEQLWSRCTQTQYLQQTSVIRIMHYAVAPLPHVTRLIYFQPMEEIKYYLDQPKPAICVTWCQLRSVSWNWYLCSTSQLCS